MYPLNWNSSYVKQISNTASANLSGPKEANVFPCFRIAKFLLNFPLYPVCFFLSLPQLISLCPTTFFQIHQNYGFYYK